MIKAIDLNYTLKRIDIEILILIFKKSLFEICFQKKLNKLVKVHLIRKYRIILNILNYKKNNE
jgi:ribosomal protein L29